MNGRMAAGGPAGPDFQEIGVVRISDVNGSARPLDLGVTTQAEVRIAFSEHFPVDRAVRTVADRAALAQGFVLEHKRARLLAMT